MLSHFSRVQLFVTPWTVAHQVPLSMGFSRQEYWSGLPFPSPYLVLSGPSINPETFLIVKKLQQGEGNGNPLQYSCLENPMDGEA